MNQIVPLKQIRNNLSELVSRVSYGGQKVVITKNGKPTAAIISYEDYEKIMDPSKRFTDEEWQKGFEFIHKARSASKNISEKDALKIINREIAEVRKKRNAKSSS